MFKHISSLNLQENNPNAKNGNRFDEENIPLYILISMAGEYFTDILYQLFGFPSSRQCRNLKKKFREKYGIIDNILKGSYESLSQLFSLFWKSQDKRFIVEVDTASVNAQVLIKKNGDVEGLLEDMKHESDLVDLYSTNTDEFYSFYMQNHDEIVKYFFVYYICSLSDQNRSFPILIRKKASGFANDKTTAYL